MKKINKILSWGLFEEKLNGVYENRFCQRAVFKKGLFHSENSVAFQDRDLGKHIYRYIICQFNVKSRIENEKK